MAPPRTKTQPGGVQRTDDGQSEPTDHGTVVTPKQYDDLPSAVLAFQAEMPTIAKGEIAVVTTKGGGEYSYRYADLASIVKVAGPVMHRHGLVFTATARHVAGGAYELVGVLTHAPSGEREEGALPLFGRTMQEIGSSITYARRYLLGCLTGLVTDEDTDGQPATEERTYTGNVGFPPGVTPTTTLNYVDERDRAYRRWSASVQDGTQQQFMAAITATTGKAWENLMATDFAEFWQGPVSSMSYGGES